MRTTVEVNGVAAATAARIVDAQRRYLDDEERTFFTSILNAAPYAIFGTFTFKHHVNARRANAVFDEFVSHLSSEVYRDNIGWIRSTETKYSGCSDYGVGLHFHFVMISCAPLSAEDIEDRWAIAFGDADCTNFDKHQNGIAYIFKMRDAHGADWDLSENLRLFQRGRRPKNKRERRVLRRQAERSAGRETEREVG